MPALLIREVAVHDLHVRRVLCVLPVCLCVCVYVCEGEVSSCGRIPADLCHMLHSWDNLGTFFSLAVSFLSVPYLMPGKATCPLPV